MASRWRGQKRKPKPVHASDLVVEKLSWDEVFKYAKGIPKPIQIKISRMDNPPTILRSFVLEGTHEDVLKLVLSEEYFPSVKASIDILKESLQSKRTKMEDDAPTPSDYGKSISPTDVICDHRFFHDLHVTLQVQAFEMFMSTMKNPCNVPSRYFRTATTVMQEMSKSYPDEKSRVQQFSQAVNQLGKMFQFGNRTGAKFSTDCTVTVGGIPIANWEFKNEFCRVSTCPVAQNQAYFIHLQKGRKDRSPMLLISVVGPYHIQVYGVVWNGSKCVCMDPLHSPQSMLFVPRDPRFEVHQLAKLFLAIDVSMSKLVEYYSERAKDADADSDTDRGPYWTYDGRLHYKGRLLNSVKWLYVATLDEDQDVLVKFIRGRYGKEAHELLAAKSLAPKLIHHCILPGGLWHAVVMEKIEGYTMDHSENSKKSLKEAVDVLHSNNFVHGDLRPQNVLVVGESVRIVDFDWADTVGAASYPPELNVSVEGSWEPSVVPGGNILKVHDEFQLNDAVYH